jgi:sialic acid synthase SpsE
MTINRDFFEDLFVLELANNHWGRIERGKKIVDDFAHVVRYNGIRASIKLQFRDVDSFIHKDHVGNSDVRYIKKTLDTKMSKQHFGELVDYIRKSGCIPTATPFDEASLPRNLTSRC